MLYIPVVGQPCLSCHDGDGGLLLLINIIILRIRQHDDLPFSIHNAYTDTQIRTHAPRFRHSNSPLFSPCFPRVFPSPETPPSRIFPFSRKSHPTSAPSPHPLQTSSLKLFSKLSAWLLHFSSVQRGLNCISSFFIICNPNLIPHSSILIPIVISGFPSTTCLRKRSTVEKTTLEVIHGREEREEKEKRKEGGGEKRKTMIQYA